ncbi:MAG: hypothetical protein AAGA54_17480 [Myxococcota bacterium]
MMTRRVLPAGLMLCALLGACSEQSEAADTDAETDTDAVRAVTWSDDVRTIVANNCTTCHFTGGSTPFAFETYEEVSNASAAILDAVSSGRMPPWPADPSCRTYVDERTVSEDDIATLQAWVDEGLAEGEPTEAIEIEPVVFEPTMSMTASEAYTPQLGSEGDDYRCIILDADFDVDTWVTGATVEPDTEAVHHVILYAVAAAQVPEIEALDAAEDGVGYGCFGGPVPTPGGMEGMMGGASLANNIASWVPGALPLEMPPNTGRPIAAGSKLVMQMHYSAVGGEAMPDLTQMQLRTTTEPPAFVERTLPFANLGIDIPAGSADATFTKTFTNWSDSPATLTSMAGHMHLLGTKIEASITGGGDDVCGLSIPSWDFDWQLSYRFPDDARVVVGPGESVELTCSYDNSTANQPIVDGVQLEPQDVQWGEGSLDEMCLMYGTIVEPYSPPPDGSAGACAAVSECYAASDGSYGALLDCEGVGIDCAVCPLQNGVGCGVAPCVASIGETTECVVDCVVALNAFGGSLDRCLRSTCETAYESLLSCVDPVLQGGSCDDVLSNACGLERG